MGIGGIILILVNSISKSYNQGNQSLHLFENLSLTIERGKWITIVGPSGSGKTTFLNCISGLTQPDKGKVILHDTNIYDLSDKERSNFRKQAIGYIFQDFKLLPFYSVLDNVALPLIHDQSKTQLYEQAKGLLLKVGITEDKFHRLPNGLSGGEKQRVAIARALLAKPTVLIGDEPTGNLDLENRDHMLDLFDEIKSSGHTIILVTHDLEVAKRGDQAYCLTNGMLEEMEVPL